jgi:hypothetical protein
MTVSNVSGFRADRWCSLIHGGWLAYAVSSSMESLVHYIVSEPYNPIPSVVKFPAFDNARQLVGTYQLMESESGPQAAGNGTSTSCSFCPTMSDNVPVSTWTFAALVACVSHGASL